MNKLEYNTFLIDLETNMDDYLSTKIDTTIEYSLYINEILESKKKIYEKRKKIIDKLLTK